MREVDSRQAVHDTVAGQNALMSTAVGGLAD